MELFGMSRGFIFVMDRSSMFSWRKTFLPSEPANMIKVWAYGWYNSSEKPWEHPKQNPEMGYLQVEYPYIFTVQMYEYNSTYTIQDGNTFEVIATNSTPQTPFFPGPNYNFPLYFGGTEVTTTETTVSFTKDLCCGNPKCKIV
eukprot:TRINITY_DN1086_c0_g2_i4.p1 TRINITY_DN1086_c0_g2~~TRINITY_DN1086_c0_g2_i4.p1  ORF type:complete len:143 (+),score=27.16 TRINITY_DN1086_c0_g2_i4:225-653(+)